MTLSYNIKAFDRLTRDLAKIKDEFAKICINDHLQEPIPVSPYATDLVPINHLEHLHSFVTNNSMYTTHHAERLSNIDCVIYEGNVDQYWFDSIQHKASHAPFSPTWITSAYVLARIGQHLDCTEVVDIGSGDGRIAFCASLLGLKAYSIEITPSLIELQKNLTCISEFIPYQSDAASFDYDKLDLRSPVFFIGGLAQMGALELASKLSSQIESISNVCWAFTGTCSPKYAIDPKGNAGWGTFIEQQDLKTVCTIDLPTAWTLNMDSTRYVFAR